MKLIHRRTATLSMAAFLATSGSPIWGQESDFPSATVRLVVPFAAGGGPDYVARLVAKRLSEIWKKQVIVDNKAGADSIIGTSDVVRAKPDGHTILINIPLLVQNPSLRSNLPFDTFKDLTPVVPLVYEPLYLVVAKSLNTPNLKSLLQLAKTQRGQFAFGSVGNGSTPHLLLVGIQQQAGVDLTHVPYKGAAPVAQAIIGGEIQIGILPYSTVRTVIAAGKGVPIAVTGTERTSSLPDVPTFKEAGLPGFERLGWIAMFVPSATPTKVVDKINRDANEAVRSPDVVKALHDLGSIPGGGTTQTFNDRIRQDYVYWHSLIRAANVKVD